MYDFVLASVPVQGHAIFSQKPVRVLADGSGPTVPVEDAQPICTAKQFNS